MKSIPQGKRFSSFDELRQMIDGAEASEPIEMDRIQYAAYKQLVWEWMSKRPDPIMQFEGHPIVVIKRSEES